MTGITVDVSELNKLAFDLGKAAPAVLIGARAVLQKGALNIKTDAKRLSSGLAHAPYYPSSITYDTKVTGMGAEAQIGPDKARPQGALGNILEYGTSKNAPVTHLGPALDREGPNFERYMAELGAKALGL